MTDYKLMTMNFCSRRRHYIFESWPFLPSLCNFLPTSFL